MDDVEYPVLTFVLCMLAVPCRRRVTSLEQTYQSETAVDGEDEWIAASSYAANTGDAVTGAISFVNNQIL